MTLTTYHDYRRHFDTRSYLFFFIDIAFTQRLTAGYSFILTCLLTCLLTGLLHAFYMPFTCLFTCIITLYIALASYA